MVTNELFEWWVSLYLVNLIEQKISNDAAEALWEFMLMIILWNREKLFGKREFFNFRFCRDEVSEVFHKPRSKLYVTGLLLPAKLFWGSKTSTCSFFKWLFLLNEWQYIEKPFIGVPSILLLSWNTSSFFNELREGLKPLDAFIRLWCWFVFVWW